MNKIYRIIWNSTLMQWVVTSELGRGKIKRTTNKTLTSLALGLAMVPGVDASECNVAVCELDSEWSSSTNNQKRGTVSISDGGIHTVNGPTSYANAEGSYVLYSTINQLIAAGYINASPLPDDDVQLNLGSKSTNITVIDPITNASTVVSVYNSSSMKEYESGYTVGGIGVARSGTVDVYYQTRFVDVTSGSAEIHADGINIYGGHRDSQLVYVDSTETGETAEATWYSKNAVSFNTEPDYTATPTKTATARVTTYAGSFSAFDGNTISVNGLSDFQNYNNWLIAKIQSGELAPTSYDAELSKAYTTVSSYYTVNVIPSGADPILSQPAGVTSMFMANGDKATVRLAEGGEITGEVRGPGVASTSGTVFRLTNGATGINDGNIETTYYTATILSGSHFINNGTITTGTQSNGVPGYGVYVENANSLFTNTGTLNVSPSFWTSVSGGNATAVGITVNDYGSAINKGTMNVGISEGDKGRAVLGSVRGVYVNKNGSFTNDTDGEIYLGRSSSGEDVYVASGSTAIITNSGALGKIENKGTITLGTKVDGVSAIEARNNWTLDITNSGTINILGNGDNGAFVAKQNVGIYAYNGAKGIKNTGLIDIQGTNAVGIKTLSGGQVSSSGQINITGGADPSTGLRNYGAWSEGSGSLVDISGSVNLKGDGAIGVHARDGGKINLSGNGEVTFADGENQIGYYIYGAGSELINTSTGTQDVTTNNSTLMRLDGGATFVGSPLATSTMSASGDNSTVVVASGVGTQIDSGGMTVNVNGKDATGFRVEGGATGTINATTTINLSGEGAIAGIADGKGYDLSGVEKPLTDGEKQATTLTAGANLASALHGVVGYIARNMATLTNSGNITFSGDNSTGIHVEEGATGGNSGNIILDGKSSVGLSATASTTATQLSTTGNITLNADWDGLDESTRSVGILANGSEVNVTVGDGTNAAAVNLNGAGSIGVYATAGSQVTLNDKVAVNFDSNKSDQIAFWVDGENSRVNTLSNTLTHVHGDGSTLFYVTQGAAMSGDLNLNLSGKVGSDKVTSGIRVNGEGSEATLGSNSQVTIGTNAIGVLAENGGSAKIEAGAAFNASGAGAIIGKATGAGSSVENHAAVASDVGSSSSTAFLAEDGGLIKNQGNIDLSKGVNHTAIDLNNGHVINTGNILANGTAIHIKGADSSISNTGTIEAVNGIAAIHVDAGAGLDLSAESGSTGTIVAKGTADGILLDIGAQSLSVANTTIDLSDASSSGIGIHNKAGIAGIQLDNTRILASGSGIGIKTGASLAQKNSGSIDIVNGTGILFQNEDGSAVASNLDFSDSADLTITVAGTGAGVTALLDGNNREVKTGVSVNVLSPAGGSAVDVSGAQRVENSGNLVSQSTVSGGSVLNVHDASIISNSGKVLAASAEQTAIAMSNAGNKTFTNTGDIVGELDFTGGDNAINLNGGSVAGDILANGGDNVLKASDGSVHSGTVTLAGSKVNKVEVSEGSTLGDLEMTGSGSHRVTVSDGSTIGDATLGDGNNLTIITDSAAGNITSGDGNNILTLASASLGSVRMGNGNNTINATHETEISGITLGNGSNAMIFNDVSTVDGTISVGSGENMLTLTNNAHIGDYVAAAGSVNFVTIRNTATFDSLDAGTGGDRDTLTFDGVDYLMAETTDAQHFDYLNLTNRSTFTTGQHILMRDTETSSGNIFIDTASTLALTPAADYNLNHVLTGSGLVDVQSGNRFDFGENTGSQFAGTVQMNSQQFALSGLNTTALTNATLMVMDNNVTTVGSGTQNIGGLTFNGGAVDFGVSIPNAAVADNFIATNHLDASGQGNVMVDRSGFDNGATPVVNQSTGLLDQQTETLVQLASATTVTGEGGSLGLLDENGDAISNGTSSIVQQNGTHAADAYYDYRLTTKKSSGNTADGLYVGYGLTRLDLLTNGADQLVIKTADSSEKTLSAQVTGSGDLGVKAGNGADALILSNLENSYTGATDLQSGTLIVGTDNALGQTSNLKLAASTTADLNGKTQTIGALTGVAGSLLNLNGGNLTLTNGGTSSGTLTGGGSLTVAGGMLNVTNANEGLSATTTVDAGANVVLNDVEGLGHGKVTANGTVTLDNADGYFINALSGSGTFNAHNGSDAYLNGYNADFTGIMDIDSTSTLTVGKSGHISGVSGIQNANQFIVDNTAAMTLDAVVSGTGELIKRGLGTLTLTGSNIFSGSVNIQDGAVAISDDANLGDGSATNQTVLDGGDLQITADLHSDRTVTLGQSGSVIVDSGVTASMGGWDDTGNSANAFTKAGNGTLVWTGDNSTNTADVNVDSGVLQVESMNNLASANGIVNLETDGTLSILKSTAADLDFTRQLKGRGTVSVDLGSNTNNFTFNTSASGGDFSGTIAVDDGRFVLNDNADAAMGLATLALNGGDNKLGSVKLEGSHVMGGLVLNGGQIAVDYSADLKPEGHLTVDTLDTTGGGTLAVSMPDNLPNPMPVNGISLFDQDDGVYDQIVAATTVNGVGSQLQVTANGEPLGDDAITGLEQAGVTVGNAHYNYFGAVKDDGLYLGYGLTQIDAFAGQSVILSNADAVDNKLGAKLTGEGGFTINASDTAYIGNAASDYQGATDVNSGKVVLITDNGFGNTSALNMLSGTEVDLNGNAQTVGQLNADYGSTLNINSGTLHITNGGTADGRLTGAGQLNLTGGTLSVTQNNSGFTGSTDIRDGATARLTKPQGLGQGAINVDGKLNLDTASGTLLNNLSGGGEVTLTNNADLYLSGDNQRFSGLFDIATNTKLTATAAKNLGNGTVNNQGTLVLNTDSQWALDNTIGGNGSVIKRGTGTLLINADNVQAGLTSVENGVLQLGQSAATSANLKSDVSIGEYGVLGGYGTVTGNVTNAGNLVMGDALTNAGHGTFTIDGNYTGNGGTVRFNTDLEGDNSSTDKLVVTGNTSGASQVSVISARGEGADTVNGIKLIDVQGSSNGNFSLNGRAVAGAYEYFLYQGGVTTPDDGDWYLRSSTSGSGGSVPDGSEGHGGSGDDDAPVYRPEASGYMANMAAANQLFRLSLEDREGRAENSSMWLRQVGSRLKHRDSSGQLHTATNSYVIQGGGELFGGSTSDTGRAGLGMMVGYGYASSKSDSQRTGYKADSSVGGYSVGLYGTWYQDATTLDGAYVDSWVQYSWLDANVQGQQQATESYNMDGFSASLEAGYRMPVYESAYGKVYLTPQGQVSWSGITADTVHDASGTRVTSTGNNNVQTRLGVKVSRDGVSSMDKGKDKLFTVYAEANWIYNSEEPGAALDGVTVSQAGSRNIGEMKVGVEGQLNKNLNVWGNVAQQLGDKGYNDTAVTLGLKYKF